MMMENPFYANDASRLSMRDDAQRRAMTLSSDSDLGSSGVVSSDQSAIPASPHPLIDDGFSSPDMAFQARKEWRQHGEGLTQVLEDKRRQAEQQPFGLRKPGSLVVRVLSALERKDIAGTKYTAYVIRVQFANPSPTSPESNSVSNLVEHRYSEFDKVNAVFKKHGIVLDRNASFPSKSWAGRVGNWTPSLSFAPEAHNELVTSRVISLDCWLVHVVNMYNDGSLPGEVAQALYEFLVAPTKPPCENNNDLDGAKWKWNNPISFTLGSGIRQATQTVQYMCQDPYKLNQSDHSIPLDLLHAAKGLCFMTVVKAGLVVSGRIGTGVLVARMDDEIGTNTNNNMNIRWSAPCAVGTVGMGWGAQMGADVTHYLVVLTTKQAVQDFFSATSLQLGAEMGLAVGPIGRGANSHLATGDWTLHTAYSYAHSQGLFVGMSLEGSVVTVRHDVNAKFYGQQVTAQALLTRPGPKAAEPLYNALNTAMQEQIPEEGLRPSTLWTTNPSKGNNAYENHSAYAHQQQSLVPPPITPCLAVNAHPQQAGSGSMESYHHQSVVIPGAGSIQQSYHHQPYPQEQQPNCENNRPQTIATMNQGPQPLFNPGSPGSTIASNGQW